MDQRSDLCRLLWESTYKWCAKYTKRKWTWCNDLYATFRSWSLQRKKSAWLGKSIRFLLVLLWNRSTLCFLTKHIFMLPLLRWLWKLLGAPKDSRGPGRTSAESMGCGPKRAGPTQLRAWTGWKSSKQGPSPTQTHGLSYWARSTRRV